MRPTHIRPGKRPIAVFTVLVYTHADLDDIASALDAIENYIRQGGEQWERELREQAPDLEVWVGDEFEDTDYPPKMVYRPRGARNSWTAFG
jgi:hypothetical protein